ncbi:neutral/alkaline ceramidase [Streptomyces californicus]
MGAINWFATHNTSITNKNTLISPDNKGYASGHAWKHGHEGVQCYLDDTPGFVAAFPNTNAGDMSPNLNLKPGSGPTEADRVRERAHHRRAPARQGPRDPPRRRAGRRRVDSRLAYVDMEDVTVGGAYTPDGEEHRTCPAVVGASTLAGSVEDGPAIPLFEEGMRTPIAPILEVLRVDTPSWLAACQYPKASLIPNGPPSHVHPVTPEGFDEIMNIGELHLVAAPGEFTIASGNLRVRRTVAERLGVPLDRVLLQGVRQRLQPVRHDTLEEDHDTQNYEGGSTLYGRYTLPAYQQEYARIADSLRAGTALDRGTAPPDESGRQFTFQTGVVNHKPALGQVVRLGMEGPGGLVAAAPPPPPSSPPVTRRTTSAGAPPSGGAAAGERDVEAGAGRR